MNKIKDFWDTYGKLDSGEILVYGQNGYGKERGTLMSLKNNDREFSLDDLRIELKRQRSILDDMAANCIKDGKTLCEDKDILRQNDIVTKLIIEEYKLKNTDEENQ